MAIRVSSGQQIQSLIADLAGTDVQREAAVARLIVIGPRAVERLVALVDSSAPPPARAAALRILENISDPRGMDAAIRALGDADPAVAAAAASALRPYLKGRRGSVPVDRLTTAALDTARPSAVRAASVLALSALERSTVAPLWKTLRDDRDPAVRALVALNDGRGAVPNPAERASTLIAEAAERGLPDDPSTLREAVTAAGGTASLSDLHRIVERVREREADEPGALRRAEWTRARGAAHVALATRGSRLALYDLRESLESAEGPLPVEFLTALSQIGDVTCLEPIAAALAHAKRGQAWWRDHLLAAFQSIVKRERITKRNAILKKIEKRYGRRQ